MHKNPGWISILFFMPSLSFSAPEKINTDDFTETPHTKYGEFYSTDHEEADSLFYQFGRFCGFSIGTGANFVTGNRGLLWQGGFPTFDIRVHYWFDFNYSLNIGFFTAAHRYSTTVESLGNVNINFFALTLHLRYYLDTKNLSAPITFANPYITFGGGIFYKTEDIISASLKNNDSSTGLTGGLGFEFVINPQFTYVDLDARVHYVRFLDYYSTRFQSTGISDLTGLFITLTGSVLFTW
jgi:hypothetical protein